MSQPEQTCSCGCTRRELLSGAGTAGLIALSALRAAGDDAPSQPAQADRAAQAPSTQPAGPRQPAAVRVVFVYTPSEKLAKAPNGWWSWPGNEFDAEGRQKQYTAALAEIEKKYELKLTIDPQPLASSADAQAKAKEILESKPDGVLVILFHNPCRPAADALVQAAEKAQIPAVYYIPLGVMHGPVTPYRRAGLYFIQSLENLAAVEYGLRMIAARKRMAQTLLLSVTEAPAIREGTEAWLGTRVRVVPFAHYAEQFGKVAIDDQARALIQRFTGKAAERRGVTQEALENAARAHMAIKRLLAAHGADGLTMNCLRRGMLKPCMSFATLNGELVPAACENDFPAMYAQMIGQLLTRRGGFQHNPCYETEANHFYGSHCTCTPRMNGPDGADLPYLLRRFAHTNEGSCAI